MSKIFKGEGSILVNIDSTENFKIFQILNLFDDADYIKYGDAYVSLTRLSYSNAEIQVLNGGKGPGQFAGSFINGYVTQITGNTIYENVQYENDCLSKGRAINNYNERSNFTTFNLPTFYVSGATKIYTGTTTATTGVYLVDTLSSITFTVVFTGGTNNYFVGSNAVRYQLHQRSTPTTISIGTPSNPNQIIPIIGNPIFSINPLEFTQYYTSTNLYSFTGSGYSAITFTYNLSESEGEFIIKGIFKWTNFTYFSNLLGVEYTEPIIQNSNSYSIYEPNEDYYFIYLKKAKKPTITLDTVIVDTFPINIAVIIPSFNGQTAFPLGLTPSTNGTDILVTVNGITLSTSEYYYSANTLYITSGYIETDDIINMVYSTVSNAPPVQTESYKITSIPNTTYPSYGQKVIYNTSTSKYEYWLDNEVVGQPVLSINGQILTNNVDFYVSSTNKKRIIFVDTLSINDIITVFYNAITTNGTDILNKDFNISWTLPEPTTNNLGYFSVQLANDGDITFSNPIYNGVIFYGINQTKYTSTVSITGGTYGQKILSKITNYKNYYTVLGELIQTYNESDIVTFTIKTNALNNY
jgi:hypothetical protein